MLGEGSTGSSSVGETLSASTRMVSPGVALKMSRAVGATEVGVGFGEGALGGLASICATLGTAGDAGLCFPRAPHALLADLCVVGRALTGTPPESPTVVTAAGGAAVEEEEAPTDVEGPSRRSEVCTARASRIRSDASVRRKASIKLPSSRLRRNLA